MRYPKLRAYLLVFLAAFVAISGPITTFAIDESTLDMFAENNIMFYDPDEMSNDDCKDFHSIAPSGENITWIGDSYSIGAESIIKEKFSDDLVLEHNVVGKTVTQGLEDLQKIIDSNNLKSYLVFALGTNSGWTQDQINKLLELTKNRGVKTILVTSKTPKDNYTDSNKLLQKATTDNPNHFYLADWVSAYQENFFDSDPEKIHPSAKGGYDAWFGEIYQTLQKIGPTVNQISGNKTGNNLDYAGNQVWSDTQLAAVEANRPFYEAAAEKSGIPWKILAAIHLKESNLQRKNPSNGQGPYQFASKSSRENCTNNHRAIFTPGDSSDDNFQKHTYCAADFVAQYKLDLSKDDNIKKLFFSYNGQSDQYKQQAKTLGFTNQEANLGEGSPYVMNRADQNRDPNFNKNWCQIKTDGASMTCPANSDYGAFVLYSALGGSNQMSRCGGTSLISGGMTPEQAKQYMDNYRDIARNVDKYDITENKYHINTTVNCGGNIFTNCVAFSQYFISQNTTDTADEMPNGKDVVSAIIKKGIALDGKNIPQPYAVFSTSVYASNPDAGHTGVVLGITDKTIILGEANCGKGLEKIQVREITKEEATDGFYSYAYLKNLKIGN